MLNAGGSPPTGTTWNRSATGQPVYLQCTPSRTASTVKMGISKGWMDVYGKDLPGQLFDVASLMELPRQDYTLEMTS